MIGRPDNDERDIAGGVTAEEQEPLPARNRVFQTAPVFENDASSMSKDSVMTGLTGMAKALLATLPRSPTFAVMTSLAMNTSFLR
jgi:hypothetical protein